MEGWLITLIVGIVGNGIVIAFLLGGRNHRITASEDDINRIEKRLDSHGKVLDKFEGRISHIEGKMNGYLK